MCHLEEMGGDSSRFLVFYYLRSGIYFIVRYGKVFVNDCLIGIRKLGFKVVKLSYQKKKGCQVIEHQLEYAFNG